MDLRAHARSFPNPKLKYIAIGRTDSRKHVFKVPQEERFLDFHSGTFHVMSVFRSTFCKLCISPLRAVSVPCTNEGYIIFGFDTMI